METILIPLCEFEELLLCTVRYSLGRKTYQVGSTCELVRKHLDRLRPGCLALLVRDIERERDLGMECDRRQWELLRLDLLGRKEELECLNRS